MAWVWVLGCNIRSCFDFPPRKGAFERGVRQAPLDRRPRRRVTPAPRHVAPERINVGCVVVVVGGRVPPYPWVRGQRRRRQHRSATEGDDVARYEDLARRAHRIEDVLGGLGQLGLDDGVVALGARRSVAGQGEADQSIREPREQAVLVLVRPNDSADGAPIEQASGNSGHSALLVVLRENKREGSADPCRPSGVQLVHMHVAHLPQAHLGRRAPAVRAWRRGRS